MELIEFFNKLEEINTEFNNLIIANHNLATAYMTEYFDENTQNKNGINMAERFTLRLGTDIATIKYNGSEKIFTMMLLLMDSKSEESTNSVFMFVKHFVN